MTFTNKGFVVAEETDYYPFGEILSQTRDPNAPFYRYGYQGEYSEEDEETGWNQFELRLYDGVAGRWLSVDPMGQYWSPYVGMGNNPMNGVDPDGGFNYKWQAQIYSFFMPNSVVEQAGGERAGEWYVGRYDNYSGSGGGTAFKRIFESGFDVQFYGDVGYYVRGGLLDYKDAGTVGRSYDLLSMDLAGGNASIVSSLLGESKSSTSNYIVTPYDKEIFLNSGFSVEVLTPSGISLDVKANAKTEIDLVNSKMHMKQMGGGVGTSFTEAKYTRDIDNSQHIINVGLQEDWGYSIPVLGFIQIGGKLSTKAGIRILIND